MAGYKEFTWKLGGAYKAMSYHLVDGRTGMVMSVGPKIDRPRIKIIRDQQGVEIPAEDQPQINLASGEHLNLYVKELILIEPKP